MDTKTPVSTRIVSSILCGALLLACPGPAAYAAVGQVVSSVKIDVPVNAPAGAGLLRTSFSGTLDTRTSALTGTLSGTGLSALAAPAVTAGNNSAAPIQTSLAAPAVQGVSAAAVTLQAPTAPLAAAPAEKSQTTAAAPESGAMSQAESISAEPGRLAAPAARMRKGVIGTLKSLFSTRKDAGEVPAVAAEASGKTAVSLAPSSETAPAADEKSSLPAPQPADEKEGGKGWFGMGKSAVMFIAALLVGQIGVEALGASMPALVQKTFGDFTVVAQLGIFASIAGIIGRTIGPVAVAKFGLKKTYLGATVTRLISISALCALLATGHMTLPLMMAFYSINGLLQGVALTAETSIPPALVGQNPAALERFWTWEQTLLEIIGVTGPIATGAIIASMGFLPALIAFPASFAIAIAILALTLKIPQKVEAMRLADLEKKAAEGKKMTAGAIFKEFFRKIGQGAKIVWHNPVLRTSFLGFTVYMMLNPFLYAMLAPAYGMALVGAANPELAAGIYGTMTGLYSLGGLLGGLLMMLEQKKIKRLKEGKDGQAPITDEQENEILRKSMLRWMVWGTVGLLGIATMAIPLPALATLVALPSFLSWAGSLTLPALALIPFGVAQVVSYLKLRSFFQSKVPEKDMADAMGFFGSASLAVSTVGLLALKYLFKGVAGFTPFIYIALALIPLAAYYIYLTRHLGKVSAPTTEKK
ncbi:MAG: MFS transporter [Elusimicrobia bacterium]|nr:MFS transporter [Elusimicrobiota bacterium]